MIFLLDDYEGGWTWALCQGSEKNPGDPIFVAANLLKTEKDARSDIAAIRKMGGALKFAKVVLREKSDEDL